MNKVYKAVLGLSAVAIVAVGTLTPVMVSAWGDSNNGRPSYTIDEINHNKLGNKITFNSISNGKIGDEKNFVGARQASSKGNWNANTIDVKDGETYTIRLYVHNNSPRGEGAIAKNVTANFVIPSTVSNTHTIVGYLKSSNADPGTYWDEVELKSSDNFYIEYVKGSAKYTNADKNGKERTFSISDEVIISGAKLGYNTMDGQIPGCYEYDGNLTIQIKVHKSVTSKLTKQVRKKGTETWSEVVDAKIGDEVEYRIDFQNYLAESVKDVVIWDVLPKNIEYVQNSTYLYNSTHKTGVLLETNAITTKGIIIGNYAPRGNAYVIFTGKVVDNSLVCGTNQLVNWASSSVNGVVSKDDASVMVTKDGDVCKDEPTPVDPTPDNPVTPETPSQIINTGAGTIVTGAVGAGSVVTALGYYIASRKKLM